MNRAKGILTGLVAAVVLTVLPALSASAEPLEDGSYVVVLDEATHTIVVDDGTPVVAEADGVAFGFVFDQTTGRVLDEFTATVDGVLHEVEIAEDGTATVVQVDGAPSSQADPAPPVGTEDTPGDDGVTEADEDGTPQSDDEDEQQRDDEVDDTHGGLVSTVAGCAPSGRAARDAGLPNHGTFVRAAAQGTTIEFDVDGVRHTADLSTPAGAEAFCSLAEQLLDEAADGADGADVEDGAAESPGRSGEAPGRRGRSEQPDDGNEADGDDAAAVADEDADGDEDEDAEDRPDTPGRSGDAPGRSKDKG